MFLVDSLILVTGMLLLLGIASSTFSARLGVPVLVLFLGLGMLAGSEGIGGIVFVDYALAHGVATVGLAVILFDGGLRTPLSAVRPVWKPSVLLATVGVLVTSAITALAAMWILNISLLEGLLLGSIVGSTDAAAVFAVLRSGGVRLPDRLAATLELESGSNDPMAIFLTISCLDLLLGQVPFGPALLLRFVMQMGIGAIIGLSVGFAAVRVVNRINLAAAGLYPVLVMAFGLLTFGLAAWLGGSGFLAIYLAGIVLGNNRIAFQRGIFLFHDAAAWLSQIVLFILLGLLSFPSRLIAVGPQGLLLGAVLIFVARPVAVAVSIFAFRFHWREMLFLSWVGLKGAVPITLATFPLMAGAPRASLLFDIVFFVVVVSALLQGWSLTYVAYWLGLQRPAEPEPPVTLEISSMRHVEGDIVDYAVSEDSRAAGRLVRELALPEGVVIAMIAREDQIIPPQGRTRIEAGDHVILVLRPGTRLLVDRVFARHLSPREELPALLEFPLRGSITVRELEDFYGICMEAPRQCTLDQAIRRRLNSDELAVGRMVEFGQIALRVHEVSPSGLVEQVGMVILPQDVAPPDRADSADA
jgi:potassium/hydrogen antiporter